MQNQNVHHTLLSLFIVLILTIIPVSFTKSISTDNSASILMTRPDFHSFHVIFKQKENIFPKKIFIFGEKIQHPQLQSKIFYSDKYFADTVDDGFGYYLQIGVLRRNMNEREIRRVYRFIPAHWQVKKVRDEEKDTYIYLTGFFRTYPEALKAASLLKKKGTDCLVVAYSGTRKLTLYQARKREVLLENMIKNE
jgi:hypothetical protein